MKKLKTMKMRWLCAAMVIAVVIGEVAAALWMRLLPFQLAPLTVGVLCVGAVALGASLIYDGCD